MKPPLISDNPAPDAKALRQDLLDNVQALSGHIWTDYNIHDPGVMMLEQIAYAITEIEYRSELPISDRLASANTACNSNQYHLTPPDQVFRMQAVTVEDLEAVLSNADSSIERVTISPRRGKESGLYDIYVIPVNPEMSEQACNKVVAAYRNIRNLCEDAVVSAANAVPCTLALSLEHSRGASVEHLVAEAFALCSDLLIGRSMPGAQITSDEAFANPVRLAPNWIAFGNRARNISLLSKAVSEITDVLQVKNIQLTDLDGTSLNRLGEGEYFSLQMPDEWASINLSSRGRQSTLDTDQINYYFSLLKTGHTPQQSTMFPTPEVGNFIEAQHQAIAQELPAAYLTGKEIDTSSISERRRTQVKQFRSYLNLVDTLLEDIETGRSGIPNLYSDDIERFKSHPDSTEDRENKLSNPALSSALGSEFDRKSRALDRMLATFGEQFTQSSLKRFRDSTENNANFELLDSKKRLLHALPEIQATRCARAGFCKKLEILLDLPYKSPENTFGNFLLIEDILLRENTTFRAFEIDIAFPTNTSCERKPGYRTFVEETVSLVCPAHILPRIHWLPLSAFIALSNALELWENDEMPCNAIEIRNTLNNATQ